MAVKIICRRFLEAFHALLDGVAEENRTKIVKSDCSNFCLFKLRKYMLILGLKKLLFWNLCSYKLFCVFL